MTRKTHHYDHGTNNYFSYLRLQETSSPGLSSARGGERIGDASLLFTSNTNQNFSHPAGLRTKQGPAKPRDI